MPTLQNLQKIIQQGWMICSKLWQVRVQTWGSYSKQFTGHRYLTQVEAKYQTKKMCFHKSKLNKQLHSKRVPKVVSSLGLSMDNAQTCLSNNNGRICCFSHKIFILSPNIFLWLYKCLVTFIVLICTTFILTVQIKKHWFRFGSDKGPFINYFNF